MRFFSSTAWWLQRVNDLRPKIFSEVNSKIDVKKCFKMPNHSICTDYPPPTYSQRWPQTADVVCPAMMAMRVVSLLEIIPLLLCKHDVHQFCCLSILKFAQSHNNMAVVLFVPRSFSSKHLLLWVAQNIPIDDSQRCQIPLPEMATYHKILFPYCTHVGCLHLEYRPKKIATSSRVWRVIIVLC